MNDDKILKAQMRKNASDYSGKLINPSPVPDKLEFPKAHVITVAGMGEMTDKFLVQSELKACLEKKGYKVVLVSSRHDIMPSQNVYPFPEFMDYNMFSEYKIFMYNRFITELDEKLNPDIIINAVPGGILSASKSNPEHFGLHAFEIFNAVTPEFTLLCLYGNKVSGRYLSDLKQVMQYKFNTRTDCFYVSRNVPDINKMAKTGKTEYFEKSSGEIIEIRKSLIADTKGQESIYIADEFEDMADCVENVIKQYS